MRVARVLILLFVAGAVASCYKPSIGDMLKCADGGVHLCPDGFQCERSSGFCRRNPSEGGVDRPDADGGRDADGPDAPEVAPVCLDAGRSLCDPSDAGSCDPFCQTGCDGCRKKCSINTADTLTCNDVIVPTVLKKVNEPCMISSEGLPNQTDDCGAGLVCLTDACRKRCYQFCRTDADCTNANSGCSRPLAGGLKVCDVPFVDGCVPLGGGANMGCSGGATEACYLSSSHPTHTICDCPFMAGGEQAPCTRSRDCLPGLACAFTPVDGPICLRVCRLSNNGSDCPSMTPGSCRLYPGNPPGATTHATFGFCF